MVRLAFIMSPLTFTLDRSRITRNLKVHINSHLNIHFASFLSARLTNNFHRTLISRTISLLTIMTQVLTLTQLRPLTILTFNVHIRLLRRILNLHLPYRATVLKSFPHNLLISRNAFRANGHNVRLNSRVTTLSRFRKSILGVVLNRLHTLAFVRRIHAFGRDVRLFHVMTPLSLHNVDSSQYILLNFEFLYR